MIMPAKYDKLNISGTMYDRRRGFTDKEKERAVTLYHSGEYSYQEVADKCGMSKRTVYFLVNPKSRIENLKRRKERGGWKQYYDRESHRKNMSQVRKYKKKLIVEGEFKKAPLARVNNTEDLKAIVKHYAVSFRVVKHRKKVK